MILKNIQIVLDTNGNRIDLKYKPIRSNADFKYIIQIVAPNLATEACDITVSTYGKELINETIRTRLAVDSNGDYIKGSAVISPDETYYTAALNFNVWEVELLGTIASVLQKINTTKIAIVASFSTPVVDARALNNVGNFGISGDLPAITTEVLGDYRICDTLVYHSALISTEFKYRDIAIFDGTKWIKGAVFVVIQTCPMIQLSVDPSLGLLYSEVPDSNATLLIADIARLDGMISNTQTNVSNIVVDNVNINNDVILLKAEDIDLSNRITALKNESEAEDISLDGKITTLKGESEAEDIVLDGKITTLKGESEAEDILLRAADTALGNRITPLEAAITPTSIKELYESNIDTNTFTDGEKTKLSELESSKFLGTYINLAALQTAKPSPQEGSYAHVDAGIGSNVQVYIWDNDDNVYVTQVGSGTEETAASVKTKYESNLDTNAFTDNEKTKLGNLTVITTLNDLPNVVITAPTTGQVIKYDGTDWINGSDEIGEDGGVTSVNTKTGTVTLDTDDISEGLTNKYADANATNQGNTFNGNTQLVQTTADGKLPIIDASNVTGITITESQISDLKTYLTEETSHADVLVDGDFITAGFMKTNGAGVYTIDANTYLTSETNTTLSLTANTLTYTGENGIPTNLDLSIYLDDTNLARIISGTYNAELQTLVFTRDDNTTFSIDASMFFDDTNLVTSVNTKTGAVVLDSDDISEGLTNKYYTEAKVSANTDVAANTAKISFDGTSSAKLTGIEAGAQVNHVNTTLEGNTFNGNSQLVKTTADGKLPVIDGSNLTGLPSGGASTLNDLTDVTITTPSDNQFIRHNGTVFVNETVTILSLGNYTTSLPTTGWTGATAPFSYAATISGILSTDTASVDLDLSSSTYADIADIETSYSKVYRAVTTADTITFYASLVPTISVPLKIKVVR